MDILKKDPKILKAVEILKQEFDVKRIFLFGSRVNGKAHEDSDYDFVVVTNAERAPRVEKKIRVKALLRELDMVTDLFVYTEKTFSDSEDKFSSIPETAKNTGIEIPL